MDGRAILMIALSLVAGAAGGFGASYVLKPTQAGPGGGVDDNAAVMDELQRLRESIEGNRGALLQGQSGGGNNGSVQPTLDLSAWLDADGKPTGALAKLLDQVEARIGTTVEAKLESLKGDEESFRIPNRPSKKKMSFDEMARDLELTADEEDKLRTTMKDVEDSAMKLLADDGQSIDDVRNEIREKSKTDEGKGELTTKFTTKLMTNLGGFMGLMAKRQGGIRNAIGADKARKVDRNYRLVDPDFIDFDAFRPGGR